jgi:hypothetical protein
MSAIQNLEGMMRVLKTLLLTSALMFLLAGCVTYQLETPIVNATEEKIALNPQLKKKIYVQRIENIKEITGKYLLFLNEKSLEEGIKANIEATLINADYLQPSEPESELWLVVNIREFEKPGIGFAMTAKYVINYRLTNRAGKLVFDKSIPSEKTIPVSDSFLAEIRANRAKFGAERENYIKFMTELSTLKIPPAEAK